MTVHQPTDPNRKEPWFEVDGETKTRALNLRHFATYYFTVITNLLSNGASRRYIREFGVGVVEWRVLAVLTLEPDIPARRVREVIGLDKSSVSRAVGLLRDQNYLNEVVDPKDERRKLLKLTPSGKKLHDKMIHIALEREAHLLRGFSEDERELLLSMLARVQRNTETLNDN